MLIYNANRGMYGTKTEWTNNENGNYAKVYFRIDTKGFNCMNGFFQNESDCVDFHNEIERIIESFGIPESCGYNQNNEYLHAHPQTISGIVNKDKIKSVAEAIDNSQSMKIRWVDVYNEYADISDNEYKKILDDKKAEIIKYIIEKCCTKRKDTYCYEVDIAVCAQERFKVDRINAIEDVNKHGMTYNYIVNIIDTLVSNGLLIRTSDGEGIRSLNKTEQKKNKIDYANVCDLLAN